MPTIKTFTPQTRSTYSHGELVYSGSTFSNRRIINNPMMRSELNPVTQTKFQNSH